MRKFLWMFLISSPLVAQVSNPSIITVSVAPSGACSAGLPNQQVVTTGVMYSCQNGTWGAVNGGSGGSGTVNSGTTGQVAYYAADGTTVSGNATTVDSTGTFAAGGYGFKSRTDQNFVFKGDSITAGTGATPGVSDYPTQTMVFPWFSGRGTKYNLGVGSETCATALANYTTEVHPLRPTGGILNAYLFFMEGHNDITTGSDAATLTTCISNYWAAAKADGFTVVGMTIPRSTAFDGTTEPIRQSVNNSIRSAKGTGVYDYLVDFDNLLSYPGESTFWFDGTHPNPAGYQIFASAVNSTMNGAGWIPSGLLGMQDTTPILAGGYNSHASGGDLGAARSNTSGIAWFGLDGNVYIYRSAVSTTEIRATSFGPSANGGIPSSAAQGDLFSVRDATHGAIWFGSDNLASILRNGNTTTLQLPGQLTIPNGIAGVGSEIRGFCTGTAGSATTVAFYLFGQASSNNCSTTASNGGGFLATRTGTFRNLYVFCGTGGANSSSGVVTLYDNGSPTALTVTMGTSTAQNDTTHTVSATAGHIYGLRMTTQTSETLANCTATAEF